MLKINLQLTVRLILFLIIYGVEQIRTQVFSVQPSLTLGYAGFSINVWGSQTLSRWNVEIPSKEFDINLSYSSNNFSVTVSDYWWSGVNRPYGHYKDSHYFEGTLTYCFGDSFPLALSWSTMFAGADKSVEGKLQGSTYINASYH